MTPRKTSDKSKPWLLLLEFPCYADAQAAKDLLAGQLTDKVFLRAKHFHPSTGNIATWRTTIVLRKALSNRTFGREEVEQVLLANDYNDNGWQWIARAHKYGVIERLSKGTYRFLPPPAELPAPPVGGGARSVNGMDLHSQYSHAADFTEHMEAQHCIGCTPAPLEGK